MDLNLDNARLSREIEERIKTELRRLQPTEQKFVLERVAVDVLSGLSPANGTPARSHVIRDTMLVSDSGVNGVKQWETISAYCRSHPPSDGVFHNIEIAKALFSDKLEKKRNATISMVYTATKRRSVGESNDPHFFLLGDAKFRLATADERAKAKAK